eukprot:1154955-Pelagomonas_calceolata.AAC.2
MDEGQFPTDPTNLQHTLVIADSCHDIIYFLSNLKLVGISNTQGLGTVHFFPEGKKKGKMSMGTRRVTSRPLHLILATGVGRGLLKSAFGACKLKSALDRISMKLQS